MTAKQQLAQVAAALQLPADATLDQVLAQSSGLVGAIVELRTLVYVGIVDGALTDHNVTIGAGA